jgi:glycerol-3-phosphate dehydrogenase
VVREARVLRAWAGIRPTLYEYGPLEDRLSRDHRVYRHGEGFYSIVGGKLASFRAMAEEAVDVVCKALGRGKRCRTHLEPLPGGEREPPPAEELSREHEVPAFAAARIAYRHGAEAAEVLALADDEPELRALACPCEGVTFAELAFALRREFAHGLSDLRRRCRLAMGVCQGARCIGPAAALVASLEEAERLLDERWRGQRPVLSGDGLAQAELMQGIYFGTGALQHEGEAPWR